MGGKFKNFFFVLFLRTLYVQIPWTTSKRQKKKKTIKKSFASLTFIQFTLSRPESSQIEVQFFFFYKLYTEMTTIIVNCADEVSAGDMKGFWCQSCLRQKHKYEQSVNTIGVNCRPRHHIIS